VLAGEMAAALVKGVQSKGIGTSLKHFAANNQEAYRMVNDSIIDERTLREIYLTAFEICVKKAQPKTIMCSYNRINGCYSSDNEWLLKKVLRDEWGFEGMVVTDWGALNDITSAIKAGCDLEMPFSGKTVADRICEGVNAGEINISDLDECVKRVLKLYLFAAEEKVNAGSEEADNELACKIAKQSMVLLKNDSCLPINKEEKIAIIGEMAKQPRYQGAGSSKICPSILDSPCEAFEKAGISFEYAVGYDLNSDKVNRELIKEAVEVAKRADKIIVFAGLPDSYESEGYDRENINLPDSHNELIEELASLNKKVAVVLQLGSVAALPWKDKVDGILLSYLSGQAGGEAVRCILTGEENPSGKLAETWIDSLSDCPASEFYPGNMKTTEYREGLFVGYRYYNKVDVPVAYPFGFGLSYTSFEYSDLIVSKENNGYTVSLKVTNTGERSGREAVQIYVGKDNSQLIRTAPELKGFAKVFLNPGETKTVSVKLPMEAFRYYNPKAGSFCYEGGSYTIYASKSSRDHVLSAKITLDGDNEEQKLNFSRLKLEAYFFPKYPFSASKQDFEALLGRAVPSAAPAKKGEFTEASCLEELKVTLIGKIMIAGVRKSMKGMVEANADEGMKRMAEAMVFSMPLRAMTMTGAMTHDTVSGIVDMANGHFFKGLAKMKK